MRRRPPIRDEIRHAAERGDSLRLDPEEVEELERDFEALEEGRTEKETEE
ncbi:hypothetical protein ABNQ39_00360 (plasmid) [Azospirillum sp. A26]